MAGIKHIAVGDQLSRAEWEAANSHETVSGVSFPATPVEKDLFYRTDTHKWYQHNGSDWICLNRPNLDDLSDVDATAPSTGDILRWNGATSYWEATSEPFAITQINFTPTATPPSSTEGGMYYDSDDDHIYVGTET